MQGLFWAALTTLRLEERSFTESRTAFARWFSKRFEKCLPKAVRKAKFEAFVAEQASALPLAGDWLASDHELRLASRMLDAQRDEDVDEVVSLALRVLAAIIARGTETLNYGRFDLEPRFLETYSVNLVALRYRATGDWAALTGVGWLEWLAGHWLLDVHVRVALRKLRYQTQDTFRIVPADDGFHVRPDVPTAQFAQPRLRSALRFLHDLGLLLLDEDVEGSPYCLSDAGARQLEASGA